MNINSEDFGYFSLLPSELYNPIIEDATFRGARFVLPCVCKKLNEQIQQAHNANTPNVENIKLSLESIVLPQIQELANFTTKRFDDGFTLRVFRKLKQIITTASFTGTISRFLVWKA